MLRAIVCQHAFSFVLAAQVLPDGIYKIVDVDSGLQLHANDVEDQLVSTRFQTDDDYSRFALEHVPRGLFHSDYYRIRVQADQLMLHANDGGGNEVETWFQGDDDYNHFELEQLDDDTYSVRTVASNFAWFRNGTGFVQTREDDAAAFRFTAVPSPSPDPNAYKVLVFGDSQGDVGPTYQMLQDVFDEHGLDAQVVNKAIGGTLGCDWASQTKSPWSGKRYHAGDAMVQMAKEAFPDASDGPDFVWYTAGGNDLAEDGVYADCTAQADSDDAVEECMSEANDRMMSCTVALFEAYWLAFPNSQIVQYNYDTPCEDESCLPAAASFLGGDYCNRYGISGEGRSCVNTLLNKWQKMYVDVLQQRYPRPQYNGLNVLGAGQMASGVDGASVGNPVLDQGPNCDWYTWCVHATYGTPAAAAIGQEFWNQWLKDVVSGASSTAFV